MASTQDKLYVADEVIDQVWRQDVAPARERKLHVANETIDEGIVVGGSMVGIVGWCKEEAWFPRQ